MEKEQIVHFVQVVCLVLLGGYPPVCVCVCVWCVCVCVCVCVLGTLEKGREIERELTNSKVNLNIKRHIRRIWEAFLCHRHIENYIIYLKNDTSCTTR